MKKGFTLASSRKVSVRDISCFAIPRTTTLRGDGGGVRAFTLIELLVVVLIIGILSAIALPQYQKAINKTRAVQLIMIANHIEKIRTIHILAEGNDTDGLQNMSFDYPITKTLTDGDVLVVQGPTYTVHYNTTTKYYSLYAPDNWKLPIYLWGSINNDKLFWYCVPMSSPLSIGRELCHSITGKTGRDYGGYPIK